MGTGRLRQVLPALASWVFPGGRAGPRQPKVLEALAAWVFPGVCAGSRQPKVLLALVALAVLALVGAFVAYGRGRSAEPWKPRYVILVALETCRADHLGCYGYARPTSPNLDRLASEGTLFENAFSQSNVSLFSYASIFSGRYPRSLGALSEKTFRMPADVPAFPAILRSYGYSTAAYVAGGHLRRPFGFSPGFEVYQDEPDFGSFFHTLPPAMARLEEAASQSRPTLLFLHTYDIHSPYHKPMFFDGLYQQGYQGPATAIVRNPFDIDRVYRDRFFPDLTWDVAGSNAERDHLRTLPALYADPARGVRLQAADLEYMKATYDGSITYADTWLGLLRARIERLGIAQETLLVVFGTIGEDLFDHGYVTHRVRLNDSTLHVPLIVWGPGGIPAGRRVERLVELRALGATLRDFLDLPHDRGLEGPSLRTWIANPETAAEACAVAEGMWPRATIRMGDLRLTFPGGGWRARGRCRGHAAATTGRGVVRALRRGPRSSRGAEPAPPEGRIPLELAGRRLSRATGTRDCRKGRHAGSSRQSRVPSLSPPASVARPGLGHHSPHLGFLAEPARQRRPSQPLLSEARSRLGTSRFPGAVGHDAQAGQQGQDLGGQCVWGLRGGVEDQLGLLGRFVGGVEAREVVDESLARLGVQALCVTSHADLERCVDVDLDELAWFQHLAHGSTLCAERRDEGAQDDEACVHEHAGHLPGAANVLHPVALAKAQVLGETVAHVIPVQQVGMAACCGQASFHRVGERGLARRAQPCEPQHGRLLPLEGAALGLAHCHLLPGEMGGAAQAKLDHSGAHGVARVAVNDDERAGLVVLAVRIECDGPGRIELGAADLIEAQGSTRAALQRVDVDLVLESGD